MKVLGYFVSTCVKGSGVFWTHVAPASVCSNEDMVNQTPWHIDITFWTGGRVLGDPRSLDRKHGPAQDEERERKKKKEAIHGGVSTCGP